MGFRRQLNCAEFLPSTLTDLISAVFISSAIFFFMLHHFFHECIYICDCCQSHYLKLIRTALRMLLTILLSIIMQYHPSGRQKDGEE